MKDFTYSIGIDLNHQNAMVSYYSSNMKEPETISLSGGTEGNQIPMVMAKRPIQTQWYYGDDARKMEKTGEVILVDDLLGKALSGQQVVIGKDNYSGLFLLEMFLKRLLRLPEKLGVKGSPEQVVITVEDLSREDMEVFRTMAGDLGLSREEMIAINHRECFYCFALSQKENLWLRDVALFDYDGAYIRSMYLTRKEKAGPRQLVEILEASKEALDEENRDRKFLEFLKRQLEGRALSAVYLIGEGFDGGWMNQSLPYLCRGRRAFLGKNLFSKGACYASQIREKGDSWPFMYLGDHEMKFSLSIKVRDLGKLSFYQLLPAGKNWFETGGRIELILTDRMEIEIWKQLPDQKQARIEIVDLPGFPKRPERTSRVEVAAIPVSDTSVMITVKDLGFGEIFKATDSIWRRQISL